MGQKLDMKNGREGQALAVYFGGHQAWLLGGGNATNKANSVTILKVRSLAEEHQPDMMGRCVTLHELAAGLHDQLKVGEQALVFGTFKQAVDRKLYDRRLYAATNHHEYFAELSCAYLDQLDYYPRSRGEVEEYDKEGYKMMVKLWGPVVEKKNPFPVTVPILMLPAVIWSNVVMPPSGATSKVMRLPSADGKGKFALTGTIDKLKPGELLLGDLPAPANWKGRPVLVLMFPANYSPAFYVLRFVNSWHAELRDFGLITFGAETENVKREELAKVMRQQIAKFPFVSAAEFGAQESYRPPHALVYDHMGKCIFRGPPLDAERYMHIAVGKSILAKVGQELSSKLARSVADLLAQGMPMKEVLAKLHTQQIAAPSASAAELKLLDTALVSYALQVLDDAQAKEKPTPSPLISRPSDCLRHSVELRLERTRTRFLDKVQNKFAVEKERNARAALKSFDAAQKELSGKDGYFDPGAPRFQANNKVQLDKLKLSLERYRSQYGKTCAWDDALRIAEKWALELQEKK